MANNISEISVTELDFDLIKSSLIQYFKSDPTFSDYEFEGAGLNILLDILAYNTHLNATMANMSANEMFIDSAQLRQSVVSIAKAIGYTPRSIRTSVANITLNFTGISSAPAYITMPAGTRFSTTQGYVYSTKEQILIYSDSEGGIGEYKKENIDIYEGVYNNFQYAIDYTDSDQRFIIPTDKADISSLIVSITENSSKIIYYLNEYITLLTPTSPVYFLHENPDGRFEVTFGDGILGKKPIDGATVSLSYIISTGAEEANGIEVFSKYQQIDGYSTYNITTNTKSYGGAQPEEKEEIQKRAPTIYKAQNRAVITEDYKNFLLSDYTFIDNLTVWGGEYNKPPIYGKIFFAIKPRHTEFLSANLKEKIKNDIVRKYSIVTVSPEIVDPDYVYVLYHADIKYDLNTTINTQTQIEVSAKNALLDYFEGNTEKFNKPFYFSPAINSISNTDESIVSVSSGVMMMKKIYPTLATQYTDTINFNNSIVPGSLYSSIYNPGGTGSIQSQIIYDVDGVLKTKNPITEEIISHNIGDVDYETGEVTMNITPYTLPSDTSDIRIYCTPVSSNIYPDFNQIVLPDNSPASIDFGRPIGISFDATVENLDKKY